MVRKADRKIPEFRTLEEEAEFWDTHDFTEYTDGFHRIAFTLLPASAQPTTSAAFARFETFAEPDGRYRWRLISANGHIVASSAGSYASRSAARRAAETARAAAGTAAISAAS